MASPVPPQVVAIPTDHPSHLRRLYSTVLQQFPWYTTSIAHEPEQLSLVSSGLPDFRGYISALQGFEERLFQFDSRDTVSKLCLDVLGLRLSQESTTVSVSVVHPPTLTNFEFQKIADILSAYRFYELLSLRAGLGRRLSPSIQPATMYLPEATSSKAKMAYYSNLLSWPSVIAKFDKTLREAQPSEIPFRKTDFPPLGLLRMVKNNISSESYLAVAENFLHISFIISSLKYIPFTPGSFPELPAVCPNFPAGTSYEDLFVEFKCQYNQFMTSENTKAKTVHGGIPVSLRNAFQMSLLISPLFLLLPYRLSKSSFNRRTALNIAARLGPHKPKTLIDIENLIWNAVFQLATGSYSVPTVLSSLSADIRRHLPDPSVISPEDAGWFKLRDEIPYNPALFFQSQLLSRAVPRPLSITPTENMDGIEIPSFNIRSAFFSSERMTSFPPIPHGPDYLVNLDFSFPARPVGLVTDSPSAMDVDTIDVRATAGSSNITTAESSDLVRASNPLSVPSDLVRASNPLSVPPLEPDTHATPVCQTDVDPVSDNPAGFPAPSQPDISASSQSPLGDPMNVDEPPPDSSAFPLGFDISSLLPLLNLSEYTVDLNASSGPVSTSHDSRTPSVNLTRSRSDSLKSLFDLLVTMPPVRTPSQDRSLVGSPNLHPIPTGLNNLLAGESSSFDIGLGGLPDLLLQKRASADDRVSMSPSHLGADESFDSGSLSAKLLSKFTDDIDVDPPQDPSDGSVTDPVAKSSDGVSNLNNHSQPSNADDSMAVDRSVSSDTQQEGGSIQPTPSGDGLDVDAHVNAEDTLEIVSESNCPSQSLGGDDCVVSGSAPSLDAPVVDGPSVDNFSYRAVKNSAEYTEDIQSIIAPALASHSTDTSSDSSFEEDEEASAKPTANSNDDDKRPDDCDVTKEIGNSTESNMHDNDDSMETPADDHAIITDPPSCSHSALPVGSESAVTEPALRRSERPTQPIPPEALAKVVSSKPARKQRHKKPPKSAATISDSPSPSGSPSHTAANKISGNDPSLIPKIKVSVPRPISQNLPGSASRPIDVDSLASIFESSAPREHIKQEELSLTDDVAMQIPSKKVYTVYDVEGNPHEVSPSFHYPVYHERLERIMKRASLSTHNDLPFHLSRPDVSIIRSFSFDTWNSLSAAEKQDHKAEKNIIISNWPIPDRSSFTLAGIRNIAGPLSKQISIHDHSIEPEEDSCRGETVSGQVRDLWENRGSRGKILNGLDFPLFDGDLSPTESSTDLVAWANTRGFHSVAPTSQYPTEHMRWALVGLKNSLTMVHVDCEGLGTFIIVHDGGKLIGLVRDRRTNQVTSVRFFLDVGFYLDDILDSSLYDLEVVVLRPGDRIELLPGQPHLVLSLEDTICLGGHFYCTHQMQKTLCGLVHTFVLHKFLTNTSHPTRCLLRRMVLFFHMGFARHDITDSELAAVHMPRVDTFKGILDLLATCILVVLSNVLDPRTYITPTQNPDYEPTETDLTLLEHDVNMIPCNERMAICYARGVALYLMDWIKQSVTIHGPTGKLIDDLPSTYFAQVARAILMYKQRALDEGIETDSRCTLPLLRNQIENVVQLSPSISALWNDLASPPQHTLTLLNQDEYTFSWNSPDRAIFFRNDPQGIDHDYSLDGMTEYDGKFFETQAVRRDLELSVVLPRLARDSGTESGPPAKRKRT